VTTLESLGWDSDRVSFEELRILLENPVVFTPEDFAQECFYVIAAAGFRQDVAKRICIQVNNFVIQNPVFATGMIKQFLGHNSKAAAMEQVWFNRKVIQQKFYALKTDEDKIEFLGTLPHIGPITKFHLARNLGLNVVKYDIWIQRLGTALYGCVEDLAKINNSRLDPSVRDCCNIMFMRLNQETGEKIGFLDVVLWKACQKGLLQPRGLQVLLQEK
jgi:hypothetical protein